MLGGLLKVGLIGPGVLVLAKKLRPFRHARLPDGEQHRRAGNGDKTRAQAAGVGTFGRRGCSGRLSLCCDSLAEQGGGEHEVTDIHEASDNGWLAGVQQKPRLSLILVQMQPSSNAWCQTVNTGRHFILCAENQSDRVALLFAKMPPKPIGSSSWPHDQATNGGSVQGFLNL